MDDGDDWTDLVKPENCTRTVTLDEHFREYLDAVAKGHLDKSAVDAIRASYEARAQPGDQWCEWVLGTEPLRQMGGIAILRNGVIAWAYNEWIS